MIFEVLRADRANRLEFDGVLELVTTGPEIEGIANRDTGVVVRDLFANATQSVLVVGYAVYQGQKVFQALADRMMTVPSLQVRLFLDIQRPHGDTSAASQGSFGKPNGRVIGRCRKCFLIPARSTHPPQSELAFMLGPSLWTHVSCSFHRPTLLRPHNNETLRSESWHSPRLLPIV